MENSDEDRLESVKFEPSKQIETTLIRMGTVLYHALTDAVRLDEVEILIDAIGEYSTMASYYGEQTGRVPESMGVDLNEASIMKHSALSNGIATDWATYAKQFNDSLTVTANELGLDSLI